MNQHTHRVRARALAAVVLVAAVSVTGCTAQQKGNEATPEETTASPEQRATLPPRMPSKGPSVSDWPTKAVIANEAPRLGEAKVISKGYTAQRFLKALSEKWGIRLGKTKLIEAPGDRKVWHFSGHATHKGSESFAVGGSPTKSGDIISLGCLVYGTVPQTEEFLRDCAQIDIPGADKAKASAWLTKAKKQVDHLYEKEKRPVVSPIFVSGGACMLLFRNLGAGTQKDFYSLDISGGGVTSKP